MLLRAGAFEVCGLEASERPATEDRCGAWLAPRALVLAVADGAGGLAGGAAAAEGALAGVHGALGAGLEVRSPEAWCSLLEELDARRARAPEGGESTLVVVALWEHGLAGASAGDSEAWCLARGRLLELSSGQHRKGRLGSSRAQPWPLRVAEGLECVLLASDGLRAALRALRPEALLASAPLEAAGRSLLGAARGPSGALGDDAALLLARRALPLPGG